MKRALSSLSLFLCIAATARAQMPGATPAAPDGSRFVQLVSLEGLPSDAKSRDQFTTAFRMTFAEDEFQLETTDQVAGLPLRSPLPNRFRLIEGSPSNEVWSLQVVLGFPPIAQPRKPKRKSNAAPSGVSPSAFKRTSRGLNVVVMVLSPEAVAAGARPIPTRIGLTFPDSRATDPAGLPVNRAGYDYPWADAGRASALLALELLHVQAGALRAGDHFQLGAAVRQTEAAP